MERAHLLGHFGITAMYRAIVDSGWWWPRMRADIESVVKGCDACQRYTVVKTGYHPARAVSALHPGDHYIIDTITFPESTDKKVYCLILVDVFTGFIVLRPLHNKTTKEIARTLWEVFAILGLPRILQSDNGTEFVNALINAMTHLMGIEHRLVTAYHPQADAKVERPIAVVRSTLNKMLLGTTVYWPLFIPFVQLSYNMKISSVTGAAPFTLMFARRANELCDYTQQPPLTIDMDDWRRTQEELLSVIYPATALRHQQVEEKYIGKLNDMRKRVMQRELPPGTKVMIKNPLYLGNPAARPKDAPRYDGPYFVVRRALNGPYVIRDSNQELYERRVPIDQLKVVALPGGAIEEHKEDEWPIRAIVGRRTRRHRIEYLVRWRGVDEHGRAWPDSWLPRREITADELVRRYEREHKAKESARNVRASAVVSAASAAPAALSLVVHRQASL
jgi:transposase InsO family protein